MRRPLRGESGQIAQRLSDDGETALSMALGLGAAWLAVAGAAFLFTLRTLRPLSVLRAHARQLGGGDYAQRTGVTTNDEIGDLAREFDAMAEAIQEREQRLIRSERLATVGRMAAHIAHEVRNPLASIGLNAELLGDEIADRGRGGEAAGLVDHRRGRPADRDHRDLPALRPAAASEAGTREHRRDRGVGGGDVARASWPRPVSRSIVDIAPGLPDVAADEAQLRQALLNLVRNAREAMSGAGAAPARRLGAARRRAGSRSPFAIRGPASAQRDISKIFDPFFSTKERGTGLGLALVQQILVDHGGQIEVASPPGAGTTFTLTLPVADRSMTSAAGGAGAGGGAVGSRPVPIAERVVQGGELEVKEGRGLRTEDQGALEGSRAGGGLARGG